MIRALLSALLPLSAAVAASGPGDVAAAERDMTFFKSVEGQWSGPGEVVAGKYKGTKFVCNFTGTTPAGSVGMKLDGGCRVGVFMQKMSATIEKNGRGYSGTFLDGSAGKGLDTSEHGATLLRGRPGVLHGAETYVLQDEVGQISDSWSVSAGLDYPAVGPEHAFLKDSGRAEYVGATDAEALAAFKALATGEGILCAFESAHALAHALKLAEREPDSAILVGLSGRGDKDVAQAEQLLGPSA